MSIGGTLIVRNGDEFDYPWRQAVLSLLPICDQVVISDAGSTDGTREAIIEWQKTEPKIKLVNFPWPESDPTLIANWINSAREHLETDWHFFLTADEVLHEAYYAAVLDWPNAHPNHSATTHTRNFWSDSKHLIPYGRTCGHRGIRMAKQNVWMPADFPDERGRKAMDTSIETDIEVYHYNYLRKRDAYFRKQKAYQISVCGGSYDPRIDDNEKSEAWLTPAYYPEPLVPFDFPHPQVMHQWLKERNYEC